MAARRGTVYVIDNDEAVRIGLEKLLRSKGFAVETFSAMYQFILKNRNEHGACILVGIETPSVEVLNLHVAFRQRKIPIIVLSAGDDSFMRQEARDLGAVSFFSKPFDDEALLGAVAAAIEGGSEGRSGIARPTGE